MTFRVKYPIEAFDGGMNNKYDPPFLDDSESPDCANVVSDDRGSIGTREGSSKITSSSVGSFACDGLFTTRFADGSSTHGPRRKSVCSSATPAGRDPPA